MKNTRKLLLVLLINLTLFSFIPLSHALADADFTLVTGKIRGTDGNPLGGVTIHLDCNGHLRQAVTDSNGNYSVHYNKNNCPKFEFITGSATNNGQTQSETVQVSDVNTANIDLSFQAVSVPEFGVIPGSLAFLSALGAFYFLRRKSTIASL